jgi:hypothetical protein
MSGAASFFDQVGEFLLQHKVWFLAGGGALVAAVVLGLVIAAAMGAFAPAGAASVAATFQITAVTFADGSADTSAANAVGSYTRMDGYEGETAAGETLVAAWKNDNSAHAFYVTYSKVTATGKYITRIVRKGTSGVYSALLKTSETAGTAASVPLDNSGTWSTMSATAPLSILVTFAPAAVALIRPTAEKTMLTAKTAPLPRVNAVGRATPMWRPAQRSLTSAKARKQPALGRRQ